MRRTSPLGSAVGAILLLFGNLTCSRAALVREQRPLARSPFELVGEKIFLKAHLDGPEEIDLQFDTGAGSTVIDDSTASRLGLVATGATKNEGAAGSISVPTSQNHVIEVGGLNFTDITLLHLALGEYEGKARDAVIGYDLLKHYVVRIDYDTRSMEFYDAASYRYRGKGKGNRFRLWDNSALMRADLTLLSGERLHGDFMVDNGADLPLLVNAPFVRKHALMEQVGKVAKGAITGSDGAEIPTYRGKVREAEIGGYVFRDFPVRLTQAQGGTLSLSELDGILGNPILKKFNITFDYERCKMYWEPNRSFSEEVR